MSRKIVSRKMTVKEAVELLQTLDQTAEFSMLAGSCADDCKSLKCSDYVSRPRLVSFEPGHPNGYPDKRVYLLIPAFNAPGFLFQQVAADDDAEVVKA